MKSQKVFVRREVLNDLRLENEGDVREFLSPAGHKTEPKVPAHFVGPAQLFKNTVKEACVMFRKPTKTESEKKVFGKRNNQDERKLNNYREIEEYWGKVENLLKKKTKRPSDRLCSNQVYQYRAKREKILARTKPTTEMYGNYYWQMSLRTQKRPTSEIYLSLGSDGLYSKIQYSDKQPDRIFKPDFSSLNSSDQPSKADLLCIAGQSKLRREQDALKKVGYNKLDLNALVRNKCPEEIICEDYDAKASLP